MNKSTTRIQQDLVGQWDEIKEVLGRIAPSVMISPPDGWGIFLPRPVETDGFAFFDINPVVFNIPERADDQRLDLFVVVRGRLKLERELGSKRLDTRGFSTEVAYFRKRGEGLNHVYGAHYDFALNEIGHPAFHAQMKSFASFSSFVNEEFQLRDEVVDSVKGILKTVRLPTAQMDFFSFVLQIVADHLIYHASDAEQQAAFGSLLNKSRFLQGAGSQIARLGTEVARNCYRACHWYPQPA